MVRTCSSCGVITAPEARFCRHCGAPLRVAASAGDNGPISPLAQTVPLSNEGLTTSGLGSDDAGGSGAETKRVGRTEMEHLLRRSRLEISTDGKGDLHQSAAPDSDYAAPPTGELVPISQAPVQTPAPGQSSGVATTGGARPHRAWTLMTGLLLLIAISGAVLAYYFLRQRTPESASTAPPVSNSNQAVELSNTNSSVDESSANAAVPQQQEETPPTQEALRAEEETPQQVLQPTPKPSPSVEQTREARARQERATETSAPAATPTPAPAPTNSPVAQATPKQTPAPSPAADSNVGKAAQATSDAFYFQAVNLINGRDPRSLKRAELLRALQFFQNVKSGAHVEEARRQAQRLGRELDRQNKQSQR